MTSGSYDLIVVGGGPAGEVGAIRAASLGLKVALIEKRGELGGTCLNAGCIPMKSFLSAAKTLDSLKGARKDGFEVGGIDINWDKIIAKKDRIIGQMRRGLGFLMKKRGVEVWHGTAALKGRDTLSVTTPEGDKATLSAKNILLATGSVPKHLPHLAVNGDDILDSDSVFELTALPPCIGIIGGGVIGIELASFFGRMGSKVVVIEAMEEILPFEDGETRAELLRHLKRNSITLKTKTKLKQVRKEGEKVVLVTDQPHKEEFRIDKVVVAIGRRPFSDQIDPRGDFLKLSEGGFVAVDDKFQTGTKGIYAVGDLIDTMALAHVASREALNAVDHIAGLNPAPIDYSASPRVIFTAPEIASIGMTQEQLEEREIEFGCCKFPFKALAKANIDNAPFGFVKLLFQPKDKKILGAHIVGPLATDLIAELALGKNLGATIDDLANTIHPHPTISEAIMESAHMATHGGIHL